MADSTSFLNSFSFSFVNPLFPFKLVVCKKSNTLLCFPEYKLFPFKIHSFSTFPRNLRQTIPWPAPIIARLPRLAVRSFADSVFKVPGNDKKSRCFKESPNGQTPPSERPILILQNSDFAKHYSVFTLSYTIKINTVQALFHDGMAQLIHIFLNIFLPPFPNQCFAPQYGHITLFPLQFLLK